MIRIPSVFMYNHRLVPVCKCYAVDVDPLLGCSTFIVYRV